MSNLLIGFNPISKIKLVRVGQLFFMFYLKEKKSPFFFIFKRKVQHRVKFTSTEQTASWVLSFVVFYGWLFLQIPVVLRCPIELSSEQNLSNFSIIFSLQFIYSEKATKFCEVFILLLSYVVPVKS